MQLLTTQLLIVLLTLNFSACEDRRNAVLSALEGAATFLEEHYDDVLIDTLIGYNMMQAFVSSTLKKWNLQPGLESEKERLAQLEKKVSALIIKAEDALKKIDSEKHQVEKFASALKPGFWKVPLEWSQTNSSINSSTLNDSCSILKESNNCISFLLGTWEDGGEPCVVPDLCRNYMTTANCSGYDLSHQLFYFLFAEMQGCLDPLFLQTKHYTRTFCNSVMLINRHLEKQNISGILADLFTENILFCGLAGFSDFYKPRWLDLILRWQKPGKGCFWMYDCKKTVPAGNSKIYVKEQGPCVPLYSDGSLGSSSLNLENPVQGTRRTKRSEKIVQGECSAHNTGVAVGALGGFLYYGF